MRIIIMICALAMLALGNPSSAYAKESGRFTMTPTENGYLRMDTETGSVSVCHRKSGDWSCDNIEDDQLNLQHKLDQLTKENKRLKKELKNLERMAEDSEMVTRKKKKLTLPTEEDVDKVMNFMERMIKRFKKMVKEPPVEDNSTPL